VEIDWFTFGAQVLNFAILVFLLRRFLYGPVTAALDRREERIRRGKEDAERKREEAEREAEAYREERRALEEAREERLREAEREAERLREELEAEVREEAAESRERWQQAVRRERESLLQELQERVAEHALATTRELLGQLAHRDLEDEAVRTFVRRLSEVDEEGAEEFAAAVDEAGGEVVVRTRFALDGAERERLTEAVRNRIGPEVELDFGTSRDLILGVELRAGDRKIAWSAGDRLDLAEREVSELLESEVIREERP